MIGTVIGGRYELRAVLRRTTRSTTYDAFHHDLEEPVIVQVLAHGTDQAELLRRFRTEARVLSRMRHPNVGELLDFGQLEDNAPFVVLPTSDAPLLAEVVEHGGLSVDGAVEILLHVARGLRFAHQFGVFHLALTPSRVRLGEHTQILDFLWARWHAIDPSVPLLREFRTAAPELWNGAPASAAADLYALGHLACACLTGVLPVATTEQNAARAAHLAPEAWSLGDISIPADVRDVIEACLQKDPLLRPGSCDDVITALERWENSVASTQRLTAVKPTAYFPSVGDVFDDKYVIEAQIGQGGFARVFRARSVETGRALALKILRPDRTRDTTEARRFIREGKLVFTMLTNPHTISVYGYGESANELLYIAFEFIDGRTLESMLDSGAPLGPKRVVRILEQCLVSLSEAHGMGVLHRDIKPSNIMLSDRDGVEDWVTLLDFGVAKITSDIVDQKELTVAGTAIGTPRYMSPEQIAGDTLGPESDLYSLGLVTYELLTGEPAMGGENVLEILAAQLDPQSVILPVTSYVPAPLALIVNRLMRKDRKSRYLTAGDVLSDLRMLEQEVGDATVDTGTR